MRIIEIVVNKIIDVIKENDKNSKKVIQDLQKVIYDASFTSPEVMGMRWNHVYNILCTYLIDCKTHKLYKNKLFGIEIFSIFSGNSEEEIRKVLL